MIAGALFPVGFTHNFMVDSADAKTLISALAALLSEKRSERRGLASAMAGFLMRRAAELLVKMRRKEPAPKGRKPTSL